MNTPDLEKLKDGFTFSSYHAESIHKTFLEKEGNIWLTRLAQIGMTHRLRLPDKAGNANVFWHNPTFLPVRRVIRGLVWPGDAHFASDKQLAQLRKYVSSVVFRTQIRNPESRNRDFRFSIMDCWIHEDSLEPDVAEGLHEKHFNFEKPLFKNGMHFSHLRHHAFLSDPEHDLPKDQIVEQDDLSAITTHEVQL